MSFLAEAFKYQAFIKRIASGVVKHVEGVGNGTVVDSQAVQNAVAAAGVNGHIVFTPGKTYLVDRLTQLLPGQTVWAYGARIKRQQQFVTTSAATIAQGGTSVVVSSVTGFEVGQQIGLFTDDTHYSTSNSRIDSIDVGTKTISVLGSAFSLLGGLSCATPNVFLSFDVFRTAEGCKILGLGFDGNRANWGFYRWELTNEVHAYYSRNMVKDCYFFNCPGEVIQESGTGNYTSLGNVFDNNHIESAHGNGIHLSGSTGTRVTGNFITDTNLQGVAVGHNGGSVTVSNGVVDYLIDGNRLANGRSGVGEISSIDNSRYAITNNQIINMSTYMVESRGFNANISDINISGNTFYNDTAPAAAALIGVNIEETGSGETSRVVLANNEFFNAGCYVAKARGVSAMGNAFNTTYQAADTFHNSFTLNNLSEASIIGNSTKNGNAGLTLNGNMTNVLVSNNSINTPYYYGIFGIGATNSNLSYIGNTINMDNNVNTSAQAMTVGANSCAKSNTIKMTAGHSCIRVNAVANAVVQGNTCRTFAANKSIRVEAGSTGYVVVDNQVTHAVLDTPAVGVRVANNDIIV